jgi:putative peptide zinc metalloprotease protein
MTASTEARTEIREAPVSAALARAEGVELLGDVHGSGYENGAALVRRADGQMVQLGPLMYALLECVDGQRSISELSACLSEQVGRDFDEEHVVALAEKLGAQGLLAGTEDNAPPRSNPLLALRWKVLVTNPRVTRWLTAPFTPLYRPWVVWPLVAAFAAVVVYVLFFEGVSAATADAFQSPELLLLVFGLAVASAGFHEIGHAAACRYGGATAGGMGCGLYMVWPAFYTDVTDAYRLPRGDRLRVDLGGIYFNAVVSVATFAAWLVWHVDALLLVIALQLLMIVKNLSPVIRSDGYHILADATGVPDLYAHIAPTLRRLVPWHYSERSALRGRARALVTLWVLIVVPILLSLMIGAALLLPRVMTSTWESGRNVLGDISQDASNGDVLMLAVSLLRLVALVLPVLGSVMIVQMLGRMVVRRAQAWSEGSPARGVVVALAGAAALCGVAWALWPAGQYQPVRASDRGTLVSFAHTIVAPASAARPAVTPFANVQDVLTPGRHLAVSMIPVGGATKEHPAFFIVGGRRQGDDAVVLVSDTAPDPADAPTVDDPTPTATAPPATTGASSTPVAARAFPFKLPSKPGPGDTQALATGTRDGAVTYDIAYSVVTVKDGADVKNTNGAYALASCNACTTVAVSFQVVLVVGQSNVIMPVNIAEALNNNCPACVTVAIADQIVVTITKLPSQELLDKLNATLAKLNGLSSIPLSQVASTVMAVQHEIEDELNDSGLLAKPPASTTTAGTTTTAAQSTTTSPATTTASTTTSPAAAPAPTTTSAPAQSTTTAPTTTSAEETTPAPTTTETSTTTPTTTAETTTTTTTG